MKNKSISVLSAVLAVLSLNDAAMAKPKISMAGTRAARTQKIKIEDNDQLRVKLDVSDQVLQVWGSDVDRAIDSQVTATIESSYPGYSDKFVCASAMAMKSKQFDDGLYAAVEYAAQSGCGKMKSKAWLLKTIATELGKENIPGKSNVQSVMLSASELGKLGVPVPDRLKSHVELYKQEFLANEGMSKPLSFYTWSEDLKRIFQQDRMIQTKLEGETGVKTLARLMRKDPAVAGAYDRYLTLASELTNPLKYKDLRQCIAAPSARAKDWKDLYFLPASKSHEVTLVEKLYGNRPIPEGFNLVDQLIKRIRSGQVNLKPKSNSGWYDYQTWALEPLVVPDRMPEHNHVTFDDSYKRQLEEMFKGFLAMSRETHVKQLGGGGAGGAGMSLEIHIYPNVSTEPLASFYIRKAKSYRFVRHVLENAFGREALKSLHRLTAKGKSKQNLLDELQQMEDIFSGAYLTVSDEIYMDPVRNERLDGSPISKASKKVFSNWMDSAYADPDVNQDVRMMVPVFYDFIRQKWKVWAVLGWANTDISVGFAKEPKILGWKSKMSRTFLGASVGRDGKVISPSRELTIDEMPWTTSQSPDGAFEKASIYFESEGHKTAFPVSMELYVDKILDRDEFRKLCDEQNGDVGRILKALRGEPQEDE